MLNPQWKKFVIHHVSMKHEDPKIFIRSEWQKTTDNSVIYLAVRCCIAIFFLTTWMISVVDNEENPDVPESYHPAKWLIYLTNWGYTICTVQALLSVIMFCSNLFFERKKLTNGPDVVTNKLYKVYWAINVISLDIAMGITILFWSLIYRDTGTGVEAMNLIVHAFNSIVMFIDLCIVAHPIRLLHCYWTILLGTCYVIFSVVYYLAGGTSQVGSSAIYNILDWDAPGATTLICFGVLVFLIILHVFFYGMFRLRRYLRKRILGPKKKVTGETTAQIQVSSLKGYVNEGLTTETA